MFLYNQTMEHITININYNYIIKIDKSQQHNTVSKKQTSDNNIQCDTFLKLKNNTTKQYIIQTHVYVIKPTKNTHKGTINVKSRIVVTWNKEGTLRQKKINSNILVIGLVNKYLFCYSQILWGLRDTLATKTPKNAGSVITNFFTQCIAKFARK